LRFGLSPIQSENRFDGMLHQAGLAEELGYDVLWAHEHHSGAAMYPSPLMTLAVLAGRTQRIGLGTNMLLLPLHHPLRVAGDGAMVDVLSGGRLRLGVSAGYAPADLRAFAVPKGERARRLRDGLSLIRAVWTGEHVSLENSQSQLADFTLVPKPLQQPAPLIYVGGTVDGAIRQAARLGDELLISTTQRIGDISRVLDVYHAELRKLGKDPTQKRTALNRIVHVIPDGASKQSAVDFFTRRFLRLYDAWGHQNVTELGEAARSAHEVDKDHFIIGEPAECIDRIARYAALGVKEIACLMNFGGPDKATVERSMRLFAERVMPQSRTP
jgi:alkanesulfonate monooxygenase SsuD/methylene tetrahydromethanopterin reductase-like flavin-dependent oxidoreductase (luciferase family)